MFCVVEQDRLILRVPEKDHPRFLEMEHVAPMDFTGRTAKSMVYVLPQGTVNLSELGVALVVGVGGAIDVVAGVTRRAPRWMQRAGLEWLFRFLQEPRRLGQRYVNTNATFALLLARELVRTRTAAGRG